MTMLTKKQMVNIAFLETIKEKYNLTNLDLLKIICYNINRGKYDNLKKE